MSPRQTLMSKAVLLPLLMTLTLWILPNASNAATPTVSKTKNLAQCTTDTDCDSSKTFLRCSNKKCQCLYVNYFDEEINRCLIRVGASCEVRSQSQYCVAYADCKPKSNGSTAKEGTCHCRPKYKETIDGLCAAGSGGSSSRVSFDLVFYSTLLFCLILPAKAWYQDP